MARSPISLKTSIDDRDLGLDELLDDLLDDEFDAVDIGLLTDEDEQFIIIGGANEFGTRDGHIPERSFIRAGVDENEPDINQHADRLWSEIIAGRVSKLDALARMGELIQRHIQRKITTLRFPPNALSTIKKKKSSNPLIDTGRMRASIQWVLANTSDGESGL